MASAAPRDTVNGRNTVITSAVPEHSALGGSSSPFQQQQQQQQQSKPRGLAALLSCSCFGGNAAAADQPGALGPAAGASGALKQQLSSRASSGGGGAAAAAAGAPHAPSRKVSRRGSSSMKRWGTLKRLGSNAYSDADWFDAASRFDGGDEHEHDTMLAEVDQLVRELGDIKGPWIPDPPLAFAVPNMQFVRVPEQTGYGGYWERDDDRTTPPPQPIDVMLKNSWITMKAHNSVPGVWLGETDKEIHMIVKPKFMPPGMPRYQEWFDKTNESEPSWTLRRDLRTGRSYGKIYMTADGTLIFRVWTRPMFGNDVDVIMEEYMRLEEGGQVLVARQCCLHVASGKRAVQYLVGRRLPQPPKGAI